MKVLQGLRPGIVSHQGYRINYRSHYSTVEEILEKYYLKNYSLPIEPILVGEKRTIIDIFFKIENSMLFGKVEENALRKFPCSIVNRIYVLQKTHNNCTCFFSGGCQQFATLNLQSFDPHSLAKNGCTSIEKY